jgi:hypothetical protein
MRSLMTVTRPGSLTWPDRDFGARPFERENDSRTSEEAVVVGWGTSSLEVAPTGRRVGVADAGR